MAVDGVRAVTPDCAFMVGGDGIVAVITDVFLVVMTDGDLMVCAYEQRAVLTDFV
ncbi:hypothetical protein D3C81_2104740 [compost metagenome]